MPYSAAALGVGLRLRSRRVRSDRSQPLLTVRLAVIAAVCAALVGFFGSSLRADGDVEADTPSVVVSVASVASSGSAALPVTRLGGNGTDDGSLFAPTAPFAGLVEFVAAGGRSDALVDEPTLNWGPLAVDEQRYTDDLWAIHTQLELTSARVGLGAAFYRSQEID